jgi:hypothetical protein
MKDDMGDIWNVWENDICLKNFGRETSRDDVTWKNQT